MTGKPFQQAQIHIDIQKWIDDQINYTIDLKYKKSLEDKILELNQ